MAWRSWDAKITPFDVAKDRIAHLNPAMTKEKSKISSGLKNPNIFLEFIMTMISAPEARAQAIPGKVCRSQVFKMDGKKSRKWFPGGHKSIKTRQKRKKTTISGQENNTLGKKNRGFPPGCFFTRDPLRGKTHPGKNPRGGFPEISPGEKHRPSRGNFTQKKKTAPRAVFAAPPFSRGEKTLGGASKNGGIAQWWDPL